MPLQKTLNLFAQKYPNTDRFVVIRSLAWFDDAESEPDPVASDGPAWLDVTLRITQELADLN